MLAIGDCLQNRYRVVRQLGHGGMGTVYEAHDERFENSVALKEVLIDLAKIADPVQQQMVARAFEREAKTLALLHHEAFPHVIDYFSERDHQYLIMELIRGEDLGEQLQARKKPFEFEDVLEWTKQLLDALDYLHTQEQPIIHRDLKPQNMKITARGKVKVLDFGIAKGADSKSSSTITNQTLVAATLNYSPIEQLLRVLDPTFREFISQRHKEKVEDILEHTADARSDSYSLGATLYQLLTATQPHDTLKRALDIWAGKPDPLPNPIELNPKIPPFFNSILLKSMEIDRDSRFVSAAEMQQAIKQYLQDESNSQNEARQAAWIAEQQKSQQLPPLTSQQTQYRIAEEQKFLEDLASPTAAKTEVLPSASQLPIPPAASAPFLPQVNEDEERRRIAEQQEYLADLDSPSVTDNGNQQHVEQAALTNYGHVTPPIDQRTEQFNYSEVNPSSDQTQVSYLAGVMPAQQVKAADTTVINPQIRHEVAAPPVVQPVEPEAKSKMMWLIPVGVVGAILLVSVIGIAAYLILQPTNKPSQAANTSTGNTSTNSAPIVSTNSNSNVNTAAELSTENTNETVGSTTPVTKTPVTSTPKPVPTEKTGGSERVTSNTPAPVRTPGPAKTPGPARTPAPTKTRAPRACEFTGEC